MAGMFERDQRESLKILDLGDSIFNAEDTKTPITAMLKRGKKPSQMLATWPVQAFPRRKFTGTLDGTDISAFTHTNRDSMTATGMLMTSEGWMVTRLMALVQQAAVKNEKVKQIADDSLLFAQMIERQICSDMDCVVENGQNPYQSRGIFSWLSPSAQAAQPVAAAYRPAAACQITTPVDEITPAAFEVALAAAANQTRQRVDLTGYVGLALKTQMSLWAQKVVVSGEAALTQYTASVASKKIQRIVDFFEFEAGTVKTITSWNNLCAAATGLDSIYTPRSGAFIDLAMWELCWYEAPAAYELPKQSGGDRGYSDAVYLLKCLNPLGQVSVVTGLDT